MTSLARQARKELAAPLLNGIITGNADHHRNDYSTIISSCQVFRISYLKAALIIRANEGQFVQAQHSVLPIALITTTARARAARDHHLFVVIRPS